MHKINAYHWRRPFRRVSYRVCGITAIPDLRAQSGALPAVPALSVVDDVHDEGDEFASRSSGHIGHERVAKERTRAAVVNQKITLATHRMVREPTPAARRLCRLRSNYGEHNIGVERCLDRLCGHRSHCGSSRCGDERHALRHGGWAEVLLVGDGDRKSTRLNSSH